MQRHVPANDCPAVLMPVFYLADTNPDGSWSPGIGDPTLWGWLIALAYLACGALCVRAWRREDDAFLAGARGLKPRWWLALACVLFALGINKQLDLQSLVTVVGRKLAKEQRWYEHHRLVQQVFIGCIVLGALGCAVLAARWLGASWRRYAISTLGMAFLCVFVVVRAASFHHVDMLLFHTALGDFINRGLEALGIGVVALGAWLAPARLNKPRNAKTSTPAS